MLLFLDVDTTMKKVITAWNQRAAGEIEEMDAKNRADLLRCPFCGALPRTEVRVTQKGGGEDHVDFGICCTKCGIAKHARLKIVNFTSFLDVDTTMKKVITAWNQRAAGEIDEREDDMK